jgi:hypothetical protein
MQLFSAYLKALIAGVVALLLVVAGINIFVNPFALFSIDAIAGVNQRKTEFFKHMRLVKAYEIRRIRPEVILLGNSRVDMALNPQHPALNQISGNAYNAALTGGTLYESLRYLQHAHALRPIKVAVLGLDKGMFESQTQPDFDEGILSITLDGVGNRFPTHNIIRTTLSLDTLDASWRTFRRQQETFARQFRADGMRMPEAADHTIQEEGGYRSVFRRTLFKKTDLENEAVLSREQKRAFEYFQRLLAFCRAQKIDLRLYIHPVHAWIAENYSALGETTKFEAWKRELVSTLAKEAGTENAPFPLWDFSGYNSITSEPVPNQGDRATRMQYYWEPLHYTQITGNLILDRIFKSDDEAHHVPTDFGVLLSNKNIDQTIAQSRSDRQHYVKAFSNDVSEIERIVRGKPKPQ